MDQLTLCQDEGATISSVAGCDVIKCVVEGPDIVGTAYAGLIASLVDVGPITVSSAGTIATATAPETYTWADHDWNTAPPVGFTWQPGADVHVTGGAQGPLAGLDATLSFPVALSGTGLLAASGVQSISRSASVDLGWTAGAAASGTATIEILGEEDVPPTSPTTWQAAICHASLAGGSFRPPPELLATFKTGPNALVSVSADERTSVTADQRSVSIAARSLVLATVTFTQ